MSLTLRLDEKRTASGAKGLQSVSSGSQSAQLLSATRSGVSRNALFVEADGNESSTLIRRTCCCTSSPDVSRRRLRAKLKLTAKSSTRRRAGMHLNLMLAIRFIQKSATLRVTFRRNGCVRKLRSRDLRFHSQTPSNGSATSNKRHHKLHEHLTRSCVETWSCVLVVRQERRHIPARYQILTQNVEVCINRSLGRAAFPIGIPSSLFRPLCSSLRNVLGVLMEIVYQDTHLSCFS